MKRHALYFDKSEFETNSVRKFSCLQLKEAIANIAFTNYAFALLTQSHLTTF